MDIQELKKLQSELDGIVADLFNSMSDKGREMLKQVSPDAYEHALKAKQSREND